MNVDQLALNWETEQAKKGQVAKTRLCVTINGRRLTDLVADYEKQQQFSPFNDVFLHQADVQYYSQANWLQSLKEGKASIILLGCSCGQVECSFFTADVFNRDGWVFWRFGGWPERDYSEMQTYWFELSAYQRTVEDALDQLHKDK